ncbi:MAG: arginine--tRNA ligase [Candidatus Lightella neohaematopini]|nr:arginine--tRNA ligase [Candidatus Lightella neohaematopini]MCV2528961.1 arginine--tRNA ligase [Candidatus Lightella neohaematopini]
MNINTIISMKLKQILLTLNIKKNTNVLVVKTTKHNKFGHYQINGITSLANIINIKPTILAENIKNQLKSLYIIDKINITNTNFINIFLKISWLSCSLKKLINSSRLNISKIQKLENIVIDYSSPNIAKEMHVGHLRSTIIGDSMVRILSFLGYNVIKINHIGDWGIPFSILITYLEKINININSKVISNIQLLDKLYKRAKSYYDTNNNFVDQVNLNLLKLQNGDIYYNKIWCKIVNVTTKNNQYVYNLLNVTLDNIDNVGESFYKNMLLDIVNDLKNKGITVNKNYLSLVIINNNKKDNSTHVIIRKENGTYLYSTIDIASIKYRYEILKADKIIYYVDSRQQSYFKNIFFIARAANYIPKSFKLEHHILGMVLDKDNKPFKTREGNTIKLIDLLNESIKRVSIIIKNKYPKISNEKLYRISKVLGVGAIKYFDLSRNRSSNYVFSWDKILNLRGNTVIYIQYAYIRINSILKKIDIKQYKYSNYKNYYFGTNEEILLIIHILRLEEIINNISKYGTPHLLCDYLYNLANLFSNFYENCHILKSDKKIRVSRILLLLVTSLTIKVSLSLLGIDVVDII